LLKDEQNLAAEYDSIVGPDSKGRTDNVERRSSSLTRFLTILTAIDPMVDPIANPMVDPIIDSRRTAS
jgi:hypothetical protein